MNIKTIRFHETGGPDVLRFEEAGLPEPGPGQIRMRNTAIAVNFRDVLVRNGGHAVPTLPSGIGLDSAGVVDALGPGVEGLAVGQRIACVSGPDGAYAEARNVPAARAVPLPDTISDRTAAAIMIRGMTARYLLRDTYPVKAGDIIVVHAAAGGVGLLMCQWAKHIGATVIGTVGSDEKAEIARAHGCDHPVVYTREDVAGRVREITDGAGVPVVYDSVGKATFESSLRCLARRGLMVSFGEASGDPDPVALRWLASFGSLYVTHPSLPDYIATQAQLLAVAQDLFDMVGSGRLRVNIGAEFPLSEAARAHVALESRQIAGAVVLVP